jgi:hypothetical protein
MASMLPPPGYPASSLIFEEQFMAPSLNGASWHPWLGDATYGRWSDQGNLPSPYSGPNESSGTLQRNYNDPFPYGGAANTTGNHLVGGKGMLSLIATPSAHFSNLGYSWGAAAVSSYNLVSLPAAGGYVQWQAKMPDSRYGAWACLWLLSPNGAELDIQESGYTSGSANPNNVLASNWHGTGGQQVIQNTGVDLSAGFHTYGVEYVPGKSWTVYLDGKQMAQWTTGVPTNATYELVMDMEVAGPGTAGWHTVANPSANPGPFEMDISDVQVYSLPPPPPPGPSVPSGLTASAAAEVDLTWAASTVGAGGAVYGYDVYRNGAYLGFTATPSYRDTAVTPGVSYSYRVLAYDAAHNVSALSAPLTVTP